MNRRLRRSATCWRNRASILNGNKNSETRPGHFSKSTPVSWPDRMAGPDAIAVTCRQPSGRQWLVTIDRAVDTALEYVAAGLVLAEVAILFSGIVARYVLRTP